MRKFLFTSGNYVKDKLLIFENRLWYASWILILVLYAVFNRSIKTCLCTSKLFPNDSASHFCAEVERELDSSDSEGLLMRAWDDV